jgi:hypothetical protein
VRLLPEAKHFQNKDGMLNQDQHDNKGFILFLSSRTCFGISILIQDLTL